MANDKAEVEGWTCVELQCSGQQLETAKVTFTRNGTLYRVTCGPLGADELAQLERASRTGEVVRLVFPRAVVTLSNISIEYPKPGWAQLEGPVLRSLPIRRPGSHVGGRSAETP
jgi:hypothetical protein